MLLFLHGFLGQKEDWNPLRRYLPEGEAFDLPIEEKDIALAIKNKYERASALVGYSAGGRIALELKSRFPQSFGRVIVISGHPGIKDEEERRKRFQSDLEWSHLLKTLPTLEFLKKWYDQPLFESLRQSPNFSSMLKRRKSLDPLAWAYFLENNSVGKKMVPDIYPETIFISGSKDLKYQNLYRKLNQIEIENAGHAAHLERPKACAQAIEEILHDSVHNR